MIHFYLFDLETTGIDINKDGVVQIAGLHMSLQDGVLSQPTVMLNTMCNPGRPIDPGASEVHGITDEDVSMSPPDKLMVRVMLQQLADLMQTGPVILVGHNIERFDTPLISRILGYEFGKNFSSLDTYTIFLRGWPAMPHKLEQVYDWYAHGAKVSAHDAAADCWMVATILRTYFAEKGIETLEDVEGLVEELEQPIVLEYFPWGKHKGVPISDVPHNYLQWCVKNFTEVHKDVEFTICHLLGIDEICK